MNHIKALILKFLMIFVVLFVILNLFYDVSIENVLILTAIITIAAYVVGDLLIFRKMDEKKKESKSNIVATLSDIILSFAVIWFVGQEILSLDPDLLSASIISAVVIGAGEWFFHKYLKKNVFLEKHTNHTTTTNTHA